MLEGDTRDESSAGLGMLRSLYRIGRACRGNSRAQRRRAAGRSPTREAFHQLKKQPLGLVGLAVLLGAVLMAILAPYIAPYPPMRQHLGNRLEGPSSSHIMGTDQLGRDILSRILYGARNTIGGAAIALIILTSLGVIIGSVSGFAGGVIDAVLMRLTDAMLSFPYLVLALGLAAAFSPSLLTVVVAVAVTWWGHFARVVRGMVLSVRECMYVESARALGVGQFRILFRHVLPNVMAPVMVLATVDYGLIVLAVSALSYLGLGIQPPEPEWGMMLNEGRLYMLMAPHIMVFPGFMIFVTVLASNVLGDALRDALDPTRRIRKAI